MGRRRYSIRYSRSKRRRATSYSSRTGTRVGPKDYRFDQGVAGNGYIFIPIAEYGGRAFPPVGAVPFTEIDDGKFYPVINDGSFTIPSGQYEPAHLAKILTDGFDTLDTSRDFGNTVPKNRNFPFGVTSPFVYILTLLQARDI